MEIVFATCFSNRCKVAAGCPGQGADFPDPGADIPDPGEVGEVLRKWPGGNINCYSILFYILFFRQFYRMNNRQGG